jgi:hypothetical protein
VDITYRNPSPNSQPSHKAMMPPATMAMSMQINGTPTKVAKKNSTQLLHHFARVFR